MTDPDMTDTLEPCVGCGAILPVVPDGPVHRYMTSSAACWAVFNALQNPERPLEFAAFNALTVDAYAVQHPGVPSSQQAINSVAVHLMTLHGILEKKFKPDQAMWLRQRPGRPARQLNGIDRHSRFHWLTPPSFANCLTVADVAAGETSHERSRIVEAWVRDVWKIWSELHRDQVAIWFEKYVISERF
jgi:Family of unknown function (DUF5946)